MTDHYLDITKSVMISAPAGSGKTEKLARRYISLLKGGADVERILAITFTDKAAAEMKERILNILRVEDEKMFERVREKVPRMRISTIHSFCLKLLKRFCIDLGIDPAIGVMDSFNADILWSEAVYESLLTDGLSGEKLFYEFIRDNGVRGWNKLYGILQELHGKRPHIEHGLRNIGIKFGVNEKEGISEAGVRDLEPPHLERIISLYSKCLNRYRKKKLERHSVDYNDLELMAYEAISQNPEWQNVLFSFDEHTDHILVDEFQDTSSFQWKIIDRLTEEWRSGLGLKRDSGINPTIFLVGDDKQSIYSFRGANVDIFKNARKKLSEWLGDEYHFIEIKENYRSLPAIINFVNVLFEKLMPCSLHDDWKIEYTPFEAARQGDGGVELLLLESIGNIRDDRKNEASFIAKKINELHGKYEIFDGETKRTCAYGDMAVLLRSRTHLSLFEDAFRMNGIPFVVVKGIGFYNTPEAALLRDMLFFLIDPMDDYSLFNILRSPLFSLDYSSLFNVMKDKIPDNSSAVCLYQRLNLLRSNDSSEGFFQEELWHSKDRGKIVDALSSLCNWLERAKEVPYAVLIEEILNETGAWQYFHEKQRHVNVKKFIKLVEELESAGLTALEIREKLVRASAKADEPKANVNTEGMDAVKIMTVHASKGLQFPAVFFPCLDEESRPASGSIAMEEGDDRIIIAYEDDSDMRKAVPVFQRQKEKVQEEEKRLFYVAATRAMDYLCMSGIWKDRPKGKLAYLTDAFNLSLSGQEIGEALPFSIDVLRSENLQEIRMPRREETQKDEPLAPQKFRCPDPHIKPDEIVFIEPIDKDYKPLSVWRDVTEEIESVRRKHGDDWIVLGRAFHRLFEGLSKGTVSIDAICEKVIDILKNETLNDKSINTMRDIVMSDVKRLDEAGFLSSVVLPKENSYAELPFILQKGNRVYKGRIDRVIVRDGTAFVYDYKTYPVSEDEIPELVERYSFQMEIYKEAVEKLLSLSAEAFLFFTHALKLVKAN